jgi:choline kinase
MKRTLRTAVILAAGCGLRMKEAGAERPKGFITIGQIPIVEESIICLRETGVERLLIVTGHLQDYYVGLAERYPDLITLVHNPCYAESGSMYSLSLLAGRIEESFLLLESDLVYERRALTEAIGYPSEDMILVSGRTGSGDEVYVETTEDGLLRAMSKDRSRLGLNIMGELVGINKISLACFHAMIHHADEVFRRTLRFDYEDALVAAAQTVPVHCHLIADLVWCEIDDETHLARVLQTVYPAILVREGRNRISN